MHFENDGSRPINGECKKLLSVADRNKKTVQTSYQQFQTLTAKGEGKDLRSKNSRRLEMLADLKN